MPARDYLATETLRGGRAVEIRALRPGNTAMLKIFRTSGLNLKAEPQPDATHVVLQIS